MALLNNKDGGRVARVPHPLPHLPSKIYLLGQQSNTPLNSNNQHLLIKKINEQLDGPVRQKAALKNHCELGQVIVPLFVFLKKILS